MGQHGDDNNVRRGLLLLKNLLIRMHPAQSWGINSHTHVQTAPRDIQPRPRQVDLHYYELGPEGPCTSFRRAAASGSVSVIVLTRSSSARGGLSVGCVLDENIRVSETGAKED